MRMSVQIPNFSLHSYKETPKVQTSNKLLDRTCKYFYVQEKGSFSNSSLFKIFFYPDNRRVFGQKLNMTTQALQHTLFKFLTDFFKKSHVNCCTSDHNYRNNCNTSVSIFNMFSFSSISLYQVK